MPIQQVNNPEEKKQVNEPLLKIELPVPLSGNPNEPLTFGKHNAAAKHNFEQVANIMLRIISNQKLMSMAVKQNDDAIKELKKNMKKIGDNISKLLNNNGKQKTTPTTSK